MNRMIAYVLVLMASVLATTASAQQRASKMTADETVKLYCAAWSEPDAQRRQQLLDQVWAVNGTYTDPTAHVEGRKALNDHIGGFMQRTPGAKIVATGQVDVHHGMLRFTWRYIGADGKVMSEGIDFGILDSDGKLQKIVGFFGPTKPL